MKNFSYEEVFTLRLGMEIENEEDFRMHSGMPNETFKLWMQYCQLCALDSCDKLELETTIAALKKCYSFWNIYFLQGKEYAVEALRKQQEKEKAELDELHEKIMEKLLEGEE